jgi:hypothetical protein
MTGKRMKAPFGPKKSFPTKSGQDVREHDRLPLKPLHKISLQLTKNGMFFKIANISVGGIGFLTEHAPPVNDRKIFSVTLHVDALKFEVEVEVVHTDKGITGCRFQNPSANLVAGISKYFVTELAALKVNMVETRDDAGSSGKVLFFRGQNNCELLIQEIGGVLQRFSIILFGNYIEGDGEGHLSFGEKIEDKRISLPRGVHLFKPRQAALSADMQHLMESAKRFVDGVAGLTERRKKAITDALANFPAHVDTTQTK